MRRVLKFLHTLGALGLMGAAASLLVLLHAAAHVAPAARGALFQAMAAIGGLIFLPSIVATVLAGLLAIAVNPAFHEAGWAWAKAATGILLLEGGLHALGPIDEEAKRSVAAAAAHLLPPSAPPGAFAGERNTIWVLLAVATANVAFGVWRPRLSPRRPTAPVKIPAAEPAPAPPPAAGAGG